MSVVRKSTPQTSRPMAAQARAAISLLSGWQVSVRSMAVPPVERFPVLRRKKTSPAGKTVSALHPACSKSRSAW